MPRSTEPVPGSFEEPEMPKRLARQEYVELFGPTVCDDARARIGDVVCAAVGDRNLADSRVQPASVLALIGMHGGLTAAEVEVPLLVG